MVTSVIYINCACSIAYHASAQLIQQAVIRTRLWPSSVTLKQKAVICSGQVVTDLPLVVLSSSPPLEACRLFPVHLSYFLYFI